MKPSLGPFPLRQTRHGKPLISTDSVCGSLTGLSVGRNSEAYCAALVGYGALRGPSAANAPYGGCYSAAVAWGWNGASEARAAAGSGRRPPAVLPLGEQILHLRQDALGEELGVVAGELLAHVAELQEQHEVPDVEVHRDLAQLLGDLVGRADDHVAALDDVLHLAPEHLELVLIARRRGAGGARHLALDAGPLGRLADAAGRLREFSARVQAAAVEIFRRLGVELHRFGAVLGDARELQESGTVGIPILAEARHLLPEAIHGGAAGLVAEVGKIRV